MATPSTQRPPPTAAHAPRSVHERINGRDQSVICIDSDDEANTRIEAKLPDWAAADAPPSRPLGPEDAEFHPPPPIPAAVAPVPPVPPVPAVQAVQAAPAVSALIAASAAPAAPVALRRSTRTRINPRHDPATITSPPEPRSRRKRAAEDDPAAPGKRPRVEAQAPAASAASTRRPGTLRTAVGAARYDDPSFAQASATNTTKRKRLSDGEPQNKVARTARTQHASAVINDFGGMPPAAAPYPIPPVPAAATTRPPLGVAGWPSRGLVATPRSRPRVEQTTASSSVRLSRYIRVSTAEADSPLECCLP